MFWLVADPGDRAALRICASSRWRGWELRPNKNCFFRIERRSEYLIEGFLAVGADLPAVIKLRAWQRPGEFDEGKSALGIGRDHQVLAASGRGDAGSKENIEPGQDVKAARVRSKSLVDVIELRRGAQQVAGVGQSPAASEGLIAGRLECGKCPWVPLALE